jgi:hypothetical protein
MDHKMGIMKNPAAQDQIRGSIIETTIAGGKKKDTENSGQ